MNIKRLIHKWPFEKRMKVFFLTSIVSVSLLVLVMVTTISARNLLKNTEELVENKIQLLAASYNDSVNQYEDICKAILMNSYVQKYLKGIDDPVKRNEYRWSAKETISQLYNANDNINFIALVNEDTDAYLYRGISEYNSDFSNSRETDYRESRKEEKGAMRISYNDNYFHGNEYTLTVYFPAFSTEKIGKSYGMLCINFQDVFLNSLQMKKQISDIEASQLQLVDETGNIVSGRYIKGQENMCKVRGGVRGNAGQLPVQRQSDYLSQNRKLELLSAQYHTVKGIVCVGDANRSSGCIYSLLYDSALYADCRKNDVEGLCAS